MSSTKESYGSVETRVRILDATWKLIEEVGAGVTLADVAKRAKVSRQAIYLHFKDRSGLFVAVVNHIDTSTGSADLLSYILRAPSGVESLRRWVEVTSNATAKIDRAAQAFEANQHVDRAMAAAWRDRMNSRRSLVLAIVERIAGEGRIAAGWNAADASDLVYTLTMPGPWRELTTVLGWSTERFESRIWSLLSESLLTDS